MIAYLKPRRLLLILDNCEHLIDASAKLAHSLLQGVPGLNILATSRERLNVAGETAWRVPPLSGPGASALLDALGQSDAVTLFVERAKAAQPQFRLSAGNAKAVAQVCRRLEGLPLSLELAASRVGVLPVEQFAARLDDRLRQLGMGPRDGAERHRSLQATLDWSYDLLTEPERLLLCRLSVFSGGWTLEAAESVCSGEGIEAWDVLDLLSRLIEKSLVVPEEQEGAARYHLLEPLRVYSLEKQGDGADGGALRRRHASYFLKWAESAEPSLQGPEQAEWLDKIEQDHDNLRAALNLLRETDAEPFQRLASALYQFWYTRGYLTEGRTWLETAVADAPEVQTIARAKAVNRAGVFAWAQGDAERASHLYTRGLAICRALGDASREAAVLSNLSLVASNRERFDEAHRLQQDALEIYRRLNDRKNIAITLHNLGATAAEAGDERQARGYYSESLAMFRAANDDQAAMALRCLGATAYRTGDLAAASDHLRESLRMCRHLGDRQGIAFIYAYLGYLAAAKHLDPLAVRLLGAARALRRSIDWGETVFDERIMAAHMSNLRARVPADEFTRLWDEGADLTVEQVLDAEELWV